MTPFRFTDYANKNQAVLQMKSDLHLKEKLN